MSDLPWDDPSVDRLDTAVRARIARYWEHRARSELRVSVVFGILASELETTGVSQPVRELLSAAIQDEVRHSEICWRLAERYLGETLTRTEGEPPNVPAFEGANRELRNALLITAMCCINETIATAWLQRCFRDARAPLARAATREHLREEMNHARLGWAHLASSNVSSGMRAAIAPWLVRLLSANVPQWLHPDEGVPREGYPEHAVPSMQTTRDAVVDALREVVLPGFAELGIDVAKPELWAEQFARESASTSQSR